MKTLLIMRHAKSSWADSGLSDYERPLNGRGQRTAPRMAQWLDDQNVGPELIVASSAVRARETANLISESLSESPELVLMDEFYLASSQVYLEYLTHVPGDVNRLMFIGHNPGMETLVSHLAGQDEIMPTAAVGCFQSSESSWDRFAAACSCQAVWRPKEID